ncbi:MAG: hypothetical protein SPF19_02455 [Oliverpabstia sp.]|nr:hypothetical protein [Lachnospiraceae bacterium]MDY5025379.1 hypothetical protein [Oliverpabstia sp.]
MLNEKKIRLMTELARYEEGQGKEEMRIAKYFRSDYLGIALFKNFFLASIGYMVVLLLIAAYFSEYLLNNVHKMNLILLAVVLIGGYIITITVYSVITYIIYSLKYSRAKRGVEAYDRKLEKLEALYKREDAIKNQKQENRRKNL